MAQWKLDPAHSSADFSARHMMVSNVRGSFRNVNGTINFDPDNVEASSVEATINVNEMTSTGVKDRDNHLKSADFLDAETYPTITFRSKSIKQTGENTAVIIGDLTIRGITREVHLDAEYLGQAVSPYGHTVAGFEATTRINREDFGLTWNMVIEGGGVMVGKEIKIHLAVEAALVQEPAAV
jgi:polyisoprenoid-binding protein YceI